MSAVRPSYLLDCVAERVFAEVRFNDVPIFRSEGKTTHSISARVNAFALEGGNVVRALLRAWDPPQAAPRFQLSLYRMMTQEEIVPIVQYRFHRGLQRIEPDGFTEVFRHTSTFRESFGTWAWEKARPYDPVEREAVIEGVRRLHVALEHGDGRGFVELNQVKLEEIARSQGKEPSEVYQAQKDWLGTLFEIDQFRMEPLEPERLELEGVAQGRLVQVKGPGGQAPLRGKLGGDRTQFEVMMMRDGERWIPAR